MPDCLVDVAFREHASLTLQLACIGVQGLMPDDAQKNKARVFPETLDLEFNSATDLGVTGV